MDGAKVIKLPKPCTRTPSFRGESLSKVLFKALSAGSLSFRELCKLNEGWKPKSVASKLAGLAERRLVMRLPFSTPEGRIYGRDIEGCMAHAIKKGFVPATIAGFLKAVNEKAASAIELHENGFDTADLNWFARNICCQASGISKGYVGKHLVFYKAEADLAAYRERIYEMDQLYSEQMSKIKRQGMALEETVFEFYKKHFPGAEVLKNKFYTTPRRHKRLEADVILFDKVMDMVIVVECKNAYQYPFAERQLLKLMEFKSIFPRAIFHVYARNISNNLITNEVVWHDDRFRDVFIFNPSRLSPQTLNEECVKVGNI